MKRITKWLSGFLAALMLVQAIPTALADEIRSIDLSGSETVETYEEPIKEAEIIGEIEEKRDEYTKYFYTDMGTNVAAQYPVPVHYLDEEGKYQEIDNSLSDSEESGMVENKNAQYKIKLSKKSNGSKLVSIKGKGSEISWNLSGQSKTDMEILSTETEETDDKTVVKNAVSSAIYRDIFPAVDIEYHISGKDIKENIILKDNSAQNEFVYEFKAKGYSVSLEDKTVVFTEEKTGEVFTFSAPAVFDAEGNTTEDFCLSISNHKNNKFTLTLSVSREWLSEEERAYPVTVDPLTSTPIAYGMGHWETYVYEYYPDSYQYWSFEHINVGMDQTNKRIRSLIKLDNVPELKSADRIVRALLRLHTYDGDSRLKNDYSNTMRIGAYQMSASWDNNTTWNSVWETNSNNGISSECLDYITVNKSGEYSLDITSAARKWYADKNWGNNGLVLKLLDESAISTTRQIYFISSDYYNKNGTTAPLAVIEYRNTNGLEGYYTYQNASLGQSGTAYINNYTGQVSFSHNLLSYSNNLGGVSLDATYNSSLDANTEKFGKGWSLNIFANVKETDLPLHKHCFTDGDGTEHYFYQENGKWVDEDGLGMTYDPNAKTITFKDKTVYTFNSSGYLSTITAQNGHYTSISDDRTTISLNGTTVMTLVYNSSGRLSSVKDRFGRTQETYEYNTSGYLTKITYAYRDATTFSYDENNNLALIEDEETWQELVIGYEYTEGSWRGDVLLLQANGSYDYFGITDMNYGYNETKATFHDSTYAVCQFDAYGRTSSCYDSFGNVSTGRYNSEDGITKNKLAQSAGFFNPSFSYITDGSFSKKLESYSVTGSAEIVDVDAPVAYRAAKMTTSNSYISTVPLSHTSGGSYTVSAYVKAENITEGGAGFKVITSSGRTISSDMVTGTTDVTSDNGFRRVILYVMLSEGEKITSVRAGLFSGSGTAYLTGLTMISGGYASDNNLIANASFETSGYENLEDASVFSTNEKHSGSRSIKIGPSVAGEGQTKTYISKDGTTSGNEGDVISFGGWAKANALPGRDFYLKVYFEKTDGSWVSAEGGTAYFNQGVNTWQFTSSTVKAPANYKNISLEIYYHDQTNVGYFDDLFLIKSHQNTYTYDTETGTLTSSVDAAEQASSFEYTNEVNKTLLTHLEDSLGIEYTYNYDNKGNLTSAVSSSGQKITITYDGNSNPTKTVTSDENGNNKIVTSATYTDDGERIWENTDSRGNTEEYTYDGYHRLSSVTFDGITTSYSYYEYGDEDYEKDLTDRLTKIQTGDSVVEYAYDSKGRLYHISQGGYSYTFYYDEFGRTDEVYVAERRLVYNYYDSLGRLDRVSYGNGNAADYYYDGRDQVMVVETTGNSPQTVYYDYDAKGQVIEKTVENDKESYSYSYLYDVLGRLTSTYGGDHSIAIQYDTKNRVVTVSNTVDGVGFKTTYTYDNTRGTIQKVSSTKGSETFEKSYTLDALGRITSYLYNTGNSTVEFTYLEGAGTGTTTTLVKTMKIGSVTYGYEYDKRGNITKITKNGSEIQSYTYDNLNQLTRENNAETNETVVYTYDNHGNILSKTVYPYNNVSAAGKTINYGYDSSWTDLLVSYNGQTITYDQIGNPLNYRDGFSFKWSGGRKLTSVKLDNGSVYMTGEYRYDDNGIRTYKEVNGNVTKYYLDGSTILTEETNYGGVSRRIDYVYDENGSVYGFSVGNQKYYYQKNLQGDIIGILDKDGDLLVKYVYDAYGVPTVSFPGITSSMTDAQKQEIYILGSNNPFRYRGYYFDTETGFYYLNSRYYDPVTGRFLNADGYCSTGQGVLAQNMFAYCANNPVNMVDPTGQIATWIVIGFCVLGAGLLATLSSCSADKEPTQTPVNSNSSSDEADESGSSGSEDVLTDEQKETQLIVAQTIYGEEHGRTMHEDWQDGQKAIAATIFNRQEAQISYLGTDLRQICQNGQFDGYFSGKYAYINGECDAIAWESAMNLAECVVKGDYEGIGVPKGVSSYHIYFNATGTFNANLKKHNGKFWFGPGTTPVAVKGVVTYGGNTFFYY